MQTKISWKIIEALLEIRYLPLSQDDEDLLQSLERALSTLTNFCERSCEAEWHSGASLL